MYLNLVKKNEGGVIISVDLSKFEYFTYQSIGKKFGLYISNVSCEKTFYNSDLSDVWIDNERGGNMDNLPHAVACFVRQWQESTNYE